MQESICFTLCYRLLVQFTLKFIPIWFRFIIQNQKSVVDLRLIGGTDEREGRLEVYHAGQWGRVCDQDFGNEEAMVACRQLGYQTGYTADLYHFDGQGPLSLAPVTHHHHHN